MVVGTGLIRLHIPMATGLKDKRAVVRSVVQRLKNEFSVSAAEVGDLDKWQMASIGFAFVSNNAAHANEVIDKAIDFVETGHWDAEVIDAEIEILHVF
ncbi:MAG: DUF503 domain-containing protein [Candidatus Sericytochromatia bacterium]|uniref:DUF503 domain-containing protein n=1 Tax=Candidatus Tanganyikabacteria bacterium TaxID=2961651 RepID=A0A937X3F0_9BACT|nr:DUF503 domain-containing protein [Candidatus Tanganyikabacteria bacterium]